MRGGFVACLGENTRLLDQVAERLRWHRGNAVRHRAVGLEIVAFVDAAEGPLVESRGSRTLLVHGRFAAPIAELQRTGRRFAAIEWDGRTLRASRDPLGLAPLFYRIDKGSLWLSTEVAPLASFGTLAPDMEALSARAAFVPLDERTGWNGIYRVVPGSTVEIGMPDLKIHSARFWAPERIFGTYRGSRSDAIAECRERFGTAVGRSIEPGSAILFSGGVDSAAIAVTAHTLGKGPSHLVHVQFPALSRTQERRYATAVSDAIGVPLQTVAGDSRPWDLDAEFDLYGIPYNRLPYGLFEPALAHISASGVAVALDGHDGDGVLGPRGGEWGNLVLDGELMQLGVMWNTYGARRALRGLAADFLPPSCRPAQYKQSTYTQSIAQFFSDPLRARMIADDIFRWRWPSTRWRMRQVQPLLPRALISFEQKELEGARAGVDLRHPFADRDFVEFLISLSGAIKSDPGRPKHLLVDALNADLPPIVRDRPKSDYMAVVAQRVDRARCMEAVRRSRLRLPHVEYERLFDHGERNLENIPLFFLVCLARVHEFARRAT